MVKRDPLDRAVIRDLLELGDGSDSLLRELIGMYKRSSDSLLESFRTAIKDRDAGLAGEAAHSLKSGSGTLGAMQLAGLCEEVEGAARRGGFDEITAAIESVETELAGVRASLGQLIQ